VHEFIADAAVAKTHEKRNITVIINTSVLETKDISFINPFFKSSH